MSKLNKAIFITVRTASTRLPNKALIKIKNKTTIEYLIHRAKKSKLADKIILCTTEGPEDDILCEIAERNGILFFRGSAPDKLERWRGACNKFDIDFFVTADGDDLFYESELMDLAFNQYDKSGHQIDFLKSDDVICGAFTYGIKTEALDKACEMKDTDDTEMMWVYFTETGLFNVRELSNIPEIYLRDDIRMTLDYEDDLKFFTNIIEYFDDDKFTLRNIVKYLDNNDEVKYINYYLHERWSNNQKNKIKLALK